METGRHLYGGARQVLLLMRGLSDRGHRNTLVCPPGSDIAAAAGEQGVTVRCVRAGGDFDVGFIWRLAQVLRETRPDVAHIHSRRGADTFGGLAAHLAGVPAVLSRRVDSVEVRGLGRLKYGLYRRVIAISSCIREQLAALGVPATQLRCVRSAVATAENTRQVSRQEFLDEFGLSVQAFPIAVVAQLIPRKGHRVFFEALTQLRQTHPEVRAILFGIGPLQAQLAARVTALGLDENVRFVGYYQALDRFIGHFKLLVHPAEREGLGVSVLEAQAAGVPVVGFRAGGLIEAVAEGRTGLLVAPGDVSSLAAAIGQLVEDDGRRRQMAAAGPVQVSEHFGVDAMVAGNLAVYGEVTGKPDD